MYGLRKRGCRYVYARGVVLFCSVCLFVFAGCETLETGGLSRALRKVGEGGRGSLSTETIVSGLKEGLRVGTKKTVEQTSKKGGYSADPKIRIPVPERLQKMADALRKIGLGGQVDAFEKKMNRAAEAAATEAAPVFVKAIKNMSFADARRILQGDKTAATDYFRRETSDELTQRYTPIVSKRMDRLGVVRRFQKLQSRYNKLPLTPELNYQIEDYVVKEALDGLFTVLAKEEKKIRQNPKARTTELLRRVFGSG